MRRIYEPMQRAGDGAGAMREVAALPGEGVSALWGFPTTTPPLLATTAVAHTAAACQAPAASEEAIRLALELRSRGTGSGGRVVMFVPASRGIDASLAITDVVCGLLELQEGPLLVLDLRSAGGAELPGWLPAMSDDDEQTGGPWSADSIHSAIVSRPFARGRGRVPYAASPQFAARLADERARYTCVLIIGAEISGSAETLMIAPLVDAVVLTIAPGLTTRPEVQRLTDQLRRVKAHIIGFVAEGRSRGNGASR